MHFYTWLYAIDLLSIYSESHLLSESYHVYIVAPGL